MVVVVVVAGGVRQRAIGIIRGGYERRRRKAEMTVVARGLGVTSEGFRARERK